MAVAGTVTLTTSKRANGDREYSIAWLSDAAGAVDGQPVTLPDGELLQVSYIPDSGGTQPTNAYDFTMTDAQSVDVLAGGGANLSNAVATVTVPVVSTYFRRQLKAGSYTLVGANCGNAKGGTVVLLVR